MAAGGKKAVVIIPFYKESLSLFDGIALQQCFKVLSAYDIIAIKPESLILPETVTQYKFAGIVSFGDKYFESVEAYNQLMLSEIFYGEFLDYEFMLIYQLDAFAFRDELTYWCDQGFDYIGAPWIRKKEYPTLIKRWFAKARQQFYRRYNVKKHGYASKKQFDDAVGNGGFSLRRVKLFYDLCISNKAKIEEYNKHYTIKFNEDAFWAIELNRKENVLKIPGYREAIKFAIELYPERGLKMNNGNLPFGCHAWDLSVDFWRPVFKELGYDI